MLRGAPTNTRPSPHEVGPGMDTSYHAVHGAFGGDDDSRETTNLTFDPPEGDASSYPRASRLRNTTFTGDRFGPSHSQHRRQQTAPSLPPVRLPTRTGSPVRGHLRHQSEMPFTGDGRPTRQQDPSPSRLAGWWNGNSTPPVEDAPSPETTPKSRRGVPSSTSTPRSNVSTPQTGLGFLASSVTALKTRLTNNTSTTSPQINDELADLNIGAALQPPEQLSGREAFSPAAYKNLQINAIGLCTRMQNAYRERTIALHELQIERAAEQEEAEESALRIESLKMQLELMARKADEQQQSMRRLMAELDHERRTRQEERLTREKIIGEGSMVNEDLGVDEEERKKWRTSGGTERSEFDTDSLDSAESESVFSRSRSPTIMTSATESHLDLPSSSSSMYHGKVPTLGLPAKPRPAREMSTLQKLMKNISGETLKEEGGASDGCSNCRGQDSSMAWDTVGLLRDENKLLKHRVADLEVAVDGALDLVNGVGLRV